MGSRNEKIWSGRAALAFVSILVAFSAPISSLVGGENGIGGQNRNCQNSWSIGDSDNISTSDGIIEASVEKVTPNSAIFVEDGQVVSSTIINDIAANWESIIFPTSTNYFGNVPDADLNCQVEIVIHPIDGPGGSEGSFESGLSSSRETIFLDVDDLSGRNIVLAHELEKLIHNEFDPYEYIWVNEGAAGMSEYLSYGSNLDLEADVNSWTSNTSTSLRWWDGRGSDRGSSFLFVKYLSDKLGGASSVRQLISSPALGGIGVENLARNPGEGSTPIGSTMSELFANFSAAVTLDSQQGAFGFSEIDLEDDCSSGGFCKALPADSNDQWSSEVWQSSGHSIEGWGLKSFRFTQGNGDPLSLLVQPDRFGFEGAILSMDSSTGTWNMDRMRVDPEDGRGTGLVPGFGNTSSEVWLLVWYNSLVDDCDFDFANCGVLPSGSYPSGSFTVSANLVTSPAEVSIDYLEGFDRDGDLMDDSVEIGISISSSAYFQTLAVEFSAYTNNTLIDSIEFIESVGNSQPELRPLWFSPQLSDEWSFAVRVMDMTGELQDIAQSLPIQLYNMKPISSGSVSSNFTQTWLPTYFYGGGYDSWGFGIENGSFGHNETPNSYIWSLGDGSSSSLKNPIHSYSTEGIFSVTLVVEDQGGYFSDSISWNISVNDNSSPIPEVSIDGIAIVDELVIQTNQRVQFSAFGTTDNVPVEHLFFSWDWGDGSTDSGSGLFESSHMWVDGSAEGTVYPMELVVNDGNQSSEHTIQVRVMNRVPRQIFSDEIQVFAVTPLQMPEVFADDDGTIVEFRWIFDEGISIGEEVSLTSDFSETSSFESAPMVSWRAPGIKNVTLEVTDDDGNSSTAILQIEVINQRPVAIYERPPDGKIGDAYIFNSSSFDPDGDSSALNHVWSFSDREGTIENTSSVSRTFSEPGLFSVSLVVRDELGLDSAPKTYLLSIENPIPNPVISFSCPSNEMGLMGEIPDWDSRVIWKVPWTSEGGAFVAPGNIVRFDGSGSNDADPRFQDKYSVDREDSEWGGIVDWIWDFGDASPSARGPIVWHSFDRAGEYTVRLTVVDSFGGGEANSTEMKVIVSAAPTISITDPLQSDSDYVVVGEMVNLSGIATDSDLESGLVAWMDNDAEFDSDGDGVPDNDKDVNLSDNLEILWDIDVFFDRDCTTLEGCDGDPRNDWIEPNQTWEDPGEVRISVTVCDGLQVCSTKDFVVTVLSIQDTAPPKTLSDLTISDLVPGRESAGLLSLVAIVAALGWMIMRDRDEDELDAMEMVKNYDVDEVEAEGGLPGMDQHSPPPQPRYLTTDQRTNKESGYVRPIRTRRR
ncbi:MAG: hypothetical protein CMB67_03570 [Euryarchaeota archaeon]|nr:hypothetical protein [Euryarchaeota archaeon]